MITDTIAALCITLLLASMLTAIIRVQRMGHNALSGQSPIPFWALIVGKTSAAIPILTLLASALGQRLGWAPPEILRWLAMPFLLVGLGFAAPSLFQLGEELKFGLSQEQNATLKSAGLYWVSRNPLYLGFYLILLAACLYVPYWTTFFFAMLAVLIHHRITLAEERFLHQRFGETYEQYARQVRRYL